MSPSNLEAQGSASAKQRQETVENHDSDEQAKLARLRREINLLFHEANRMPASARTASAPSSMGATDYAYDYNGRRVPLRRKPYQ